MQAQNKRSRTDAEKKLDSHLLDAVRQMKDPNGVKSSEILRFDEEGRVFVTIRADVSEELLSSINSSGGEIISSAAAYRDIQARVPVASLVNLASRKDVIAIMAGAQPTNNDRPMQ